MVPTGDTEYFAAHLVTNFESQLNEMLFFLDYQDYIKNMKTEAGGGGSCH